MITTPQIERRQKFLQKKIKIKKYRGLEIGPYDRPIVHRSKSDIKYLDYYTTEELRAKTAPGRIPEEIVDLDYVVHSKRIPEVVKEKFDYVVASHVVEHVPNIIGWLRDLAEILNDSGKIFLAVPDKRYTFEILRPLSTTGTIIENHRNNKTKPSFSDVFDALRYHKNVNLNQIWKGTFDVNAVPYTFDFEKCIRNSEIAMQTYWAGHCNVFTYESFLQIMTDLKEMAFIPFTIDAHQSDEKPFNDFFCILKKG